MTCAPKFSRDMSQSWRPAAKVCWVLEAPHRASKGAAELENGYSVQSRRRLSTSLLFQHLLGNHCIFTSTTFSFQCNVTSIVNNLHRPAEAPPGRLRCKVTSPATYDCTRVPPLRCAPSPGTLPIKSTFLLTTFSFTQAVDECCSYRKTAPRDRFVRRHPGRRRPGSGFFGCWPRSNEIPWNAGARSFFNSRSHT